MDADTFRNKRRITWFLMAVFAAVLWVMVVRTIARDQQTAASMQPV